MTGSQQKDVYHYRYRYTLKLQTYVKGVHGLSISTIFYKKIFILTVFHKYKYTPKEYNYPVRGIFLGFDIYSLLNKYCQDDAGYEIMLINNSVSIYYLEGKKHLHSLYIKVPLLRYFCLLQSEKALVYTVIKP